MSDARELALELLRIGAVEVRPDPEHWFTWSSGKRAPIYCDNRLLMSDHAARSRVAKALAESIRKQFSGVQVIAGTATAGIPHAAWVADRLELPMVYVRSAPKGYGQGKRVEGRPLRGERVVVVEDLVSLGGSSATAVEAVRAEGGDVAGVQAIVSYGFPEAHARFAALGVICAALVQYTDLLDALRGAPGFDDARLGVLREWRESS